MGGGRILELKWVAGLQDAKGLAPASGRLDVGDNADLVEINPATVAIKARPADHPYELPERLLVVPHVPDHKVRAYRWAPAGGK